MAIRAYTIDFGGNILARIEIEEGKLTVTNAMDGWGNALPLENITIMEEPTPNL